MGRFGLGRGGNQEGQEQVGGTPGAAPPPAGAGQPPVAPGATGELTLAERLEGLRSWVAQLDRRIGVRSYAGAAALVLALAAAAVALVLVLQVRDDSASDSDIERVREEIAGVEDTASEAAREDVQTIEQRLTELEAQIPEITSNQDSTDQQITVLEDDIEDLRTQIDEIDTSSSAGNSTGGSTSGSAGSP